MQPKKKTQPLSFSYREAVQGDYRDTWKIFRIMSEFVEGYQFLSTFTKEVTIFGSARLKSNTPAYQTARKLGNLLGKNGFTTITGGGPGIMEAANRGAFEKGGESLGLNIQLPFVQRINPYVTKSVAFYYFFTRKVMMTSPSQAYVFFPGGYGTLDELFEVLDNIEIGKLDKAPVILVDRAYWTPLFTFLKNYSSEQVGAINPHLFKLCSIVNTAEEAFEIIKETKDQPNVCELSPDNFHCEGAVNWRIFRIMAELVEGFEFLTGIVNDVTVIGTKSAKPNNSYYQSARLLGQLLAEHHFPVITGGGPGIMEAANRGAKEGKGVSIGMDIRYDGKERKNPYVNRSIGFFFHFTRKLILTAPSRGFVAFPGGFGTLHLIFEILTLMQTMKMPIVPFMLYDRKFWNPLFDFIENFLLKKYKTIVGDDTKLYIPVQKPEEVLEIMEKETTSKRHLHVSGVITK